MYASCATVKFGKPEYECVLLQITVYVGHCVPRLTVAESPSAATTLMSAGLSL